MTAPRTPRWRRLIGVYDADGGLLGELAYLTGRLLGVAHCALCEITHDASGEKPDFRATRRALGVPLETTHRNKLSAELRVLTHGRTPWVVCETEAGYELLLGRADLEACRGDELCLEAALRRAIDEAGPVGEPPRPAAWRPEPKAHHGEPGWVSGPSPYELLAASLGACTAMTLRLYAERKGWPLERTVVRLKHRKDHAEDCAGCERPAGVGIDVIERVIELRGLLDETRRQRLLEIAERCPVHRTLTGASIRVATRLRPPADPAEAEAP